MPKKIVLTNLTSEIQEKVRAISAKTAWSPETVLEKAEKVRHLLRCRTIEDGIAFMWEAQDFLNKPKAEKLP